MPTKIEISHRTILFTIFILAAIWVFFQISDILFLIFIAFIIMSGLRPIVDFLTKKRIPRILSVLLTYAVFVGLFGVLLLGTIPTLVSQTTKFIQEFPSFITRVMPNFYLDSNTLTAQIAPLGENIVKVTVSIFSNVITTLTVFVFAFYFLLERGKAEEALRSLVGSEMGERLTRVLHAIEDRLGSWVLGQFFLMIVIGVFSFIGLSFLHVDFALPLAIIAGLLEIVPTIGPIISALPAVLVAISISPVMAGSVLVLYVLIHQLENNLIVPFVMKKSVGFSPIITIVALMVGGKLGGIGGAVLAIPMLLVAQEIVREFVDKKKK